MSSEKVSFDDVFTRKWLLVVLLCMIPFFGVFAYFGDPGRGRAAGISGTLLMTAMKAYWANKKYIWFWVISTLLVGIHVFLVLHIPWTRQSYPGYTLLPLAVLHYSILYGIYKIAEKLLKKNE